jgi:signal transduction histidine kinase
MGISQKNLPRIFEMFYRGSSEVPGTGLGLYICKEIIEKLNGTISAKSEVGKGTTVKLQLPAQPNKN